MNSKPLLVLAASVQMLCACAGNPPPVAAGDGAREPLRRLTIERDLNSYSPRYDLSTPLDSFITFKQLQADGLQGRYGAVNSYRIRGAFPAAGSPDIGVTADRRSAILDHHITEVLYYEDSVAAVLSPFSVAPMYVLYYYSLEDGEWLGAGEDLGADLEDARRVFRDKAPGFLRFIDRIAVLKAEPQGADALVEYLRSAGQPPLQFLLDAVATHRIVVYGELHRRKSSWDLWKRVVSDPRFAQRVGIVFLELSADRQPDMDEFFRAREPDGERILEIFRSVQLDGWYDRGMYEFLMTLWERNHALPEGEKIEVVLVDEPRPFGSFRTAADLEAHFDSLPDRNVQMASVIAETIRHESPDRNSVFIVGAGHAYKSAVPGIAVGGRHRQPAPSAAAQLVALFSDADVFSIFSHMPMISNNGTAFGRPRHGAFDRAFAQLGNRPITFNLRQSPLADEPFDGIYEITYAEQVGSYGDNYDAYLFLEPLEEEPEEYFLYDVLTDAFVEELKRRAAITSGSIEAWFGVETETREAIIDHYVQRLEGKKRWPTLAAAHAATRFTRRHSSEPVAAFQRSQRCCRLSHSSGVVSKARDRRSAMSAVTAPRSLAIFETVLRDTPSVSASAVTLRSSGSR